MAEAANSRDARRRRRILEQGSDRLAFITGRIQTLPSAPPLDSASSSISHDPNITTVEDSNSLSQNPQPYIRDVPNTVIQTPPRHDGQNEISPEPEPEPEPVHSDEQRKRLIIPSEITRAINSSRGTRLCCSVLVSLLVILSHLVKELKIFNTLMTFRPLYLVLVTNLTVVIARLVSGLQRRDNRASSGAGGDGGQYAQLARMLELCLVAKNVADAVFMDCAVYAVVLVCGLSLVPA